MALAEAKRVYNIIFFLFYGLCSAYYILLVVRFPIYLNVKKVNS